MPMPRPPVDPDAPPEFTSAEVASLAARGLSAPQTLTHEEIRKLCASALTQARSRRPKGKG